jgi:Right handed beta helix region
MSRPMLSLVIAVFLLGVGCLSARAATYYVSKSGSNSNSCSSAQSKSGAKGTINGGISCMAGGDTLIVGNGTYEETISDYAGILGSNVRPPNGSAAAYTVIKAENSRGATVTLPDTGRGGHNSIVMLDGPGGGTRYIELQGFIIDGKWNSTGLTNLVWLGSTDHIRLVDLQIQGGQQGIYENGSDSTSMIGGVIKDIGYTQSGADNCCGGTPCGPGYCHGFYSYGSNWLIDGVEMFHISGYGVEMEHTASNYTLKNCYIHHMQSAAFFMIGAAHNLNAYNNVFAYNGEAASGVNGLWLAGGTVNVIGNTFYGGGPAVYGIYDTQRIATIKNNLLVGLPADSQRAYIFGLGGTGSSGNYYADNAIDPSKIAGNMCDNSTMVGCTAVSASSTFFVSPSTGDFHNASGAPQLNAGVTLGTLYDVDHDGGARPQGTGWDVGAYEGTGTVQPPPPTRLPAPTNLRVRVQ